MEKIMSEILALIPARSGSKGIPNKNIVDLGGYPLLTYSIAAAKLSKKITRVIVTTDSEEIATIAKAYGAEVPFLRPKEISGDDAIDIDFFRHALSWLEEHEHYKPDLVVHLRPTTPFRNAEDIDEAIGKLQNNPEATALRSAHLSEYTGYKLFRVKENYIDFFGKGDFEEGEHYNLPRQALPSTFNPNGVIDIIIPQKIKAGSLHGDKIIPFITKRTADIDGISGLIHARSLVNQEEHKKLHEYMWGIKNGKLS